MRAFDRAFEIDPNYLVALYLAGGVYSRLGRHDDALRVFGRGVELTDRAPFYLSYDAWARARAGRTDEARAALAELEARAATEYVQPLHLAIVHAALGEMDRAFELLEEGDPPSQRLDRLRRACRCSRTSGATRASPNTCGGSDIPDAARRAP